MRQVQQSTASDAPIPFSSSDSALFLLHQPGGDDVCGRSEVGEVPLTLLAWGGAGLDPITSIICTDVETAAVLSFRPEAPPVSSVDPLPLPHPDSTN